MSNWISVKDRLPEDLQKVLVYPSAEIRNNGVVLYYETAIFDGGDFCVDSFRETYIVTIERNVIDNEIKHWMPLPEPPEED